MLYIGWETKPQYQEMFGLLSYMPCSNLITMTWNCAIIQQQSVYIKTSMCLPTSRGVKYNIEIELHLGSPQRIISRYSLL